MCSTGSTNQDSGLSSEECIILPKRLIRELANNFVNFRLRSRTAANDVCKRRFSKIHTYIQILSQKIQDRSSYLSYPFPFWGPCSPQLLHYIISAWPGMGEALNFLIILDVSQLWVVYGTKKFRELDVLFKQDSEIGV